ncbi:MAG: plasmid mobilization relaxosome protein MobC [Thiolinea sp.]
MKSEQRKAYEKAYKAKYSQTHRKITVTVTNTEYRDFAKQAKAENTKVSTLVRNMALAYLHNEVLLPVAVEKELAELKFLIRNIANNVNQMAHYSNTLHRMVEEQDLLIELKKLEGTIVEYTNKRFQRE